MASKVGKWIPSNVRNKRCARERGKRRKGAIGTKDAEIFKRKFWNKVNNQEFGKTEKHPP